MNWGEFSRVFRRNRSDYFQHNWEMCQAFQSPFHWKNDYYKQTNAQICFIPSSTEQNEKAIQKVRCVADRSIDR